KVPKEHIDLIERCVGWFDDRPKDARELLGLLGDGKPTAIARPSVPIPPPPPPPSAEPPSPTTPLSQLRRRRLRGLMEQIDRCHTTLARLEKDPGFPTRALASAAAAFLGILLGGWLFYFIIIFLAKR